METIYEASISSRLGRITIRTSDQGIREVALGDRIASRQGEAVTVKANGHQANGKKTRGAELARRAAQELSEYAVGKRKTFTVPLDVDGTAFQKKVWQALRTIPYGETRSYGEIARQVGNPKAARAVGMANHDNPVAIVVPCHRVIASDGSLGGYACGLQKKSQILQMEKSHS